LVTFSVVIFLIDSYLYIHTLAAAYFNQEQNSKVVGNHQSKFVKIILLHEITKWKRFTNNFSTWSYRWQ